MKKLIAFILLLVGMLFAGQIDVAAQKGTDQSIIASLEPAPASTEVDANLTLKAMFDTELDARHIKKHGIELKRLSGKKKKIEGDVAYSEEEKALTFKPKAPLEPGFYEVKYKGLKPLKEEKGTKIKEIRYRFYVPEVVNGYKLPPEPDPKVNDATLLGVDVNENGIRDDVERWIITHYAKDPKYPKTKTAIALQYAWASQKILENPTMESKKYLDDALDCMYYWANKETDKYMNNMSGFKRGKFRRKLYVLNDPSLDDKIYNTKERIQEYFKFNAALSGNIFDGRDESIVNCQTNIDELGE